MNSLWFMADKFSIRLDWFSVGVIEFVISQKTGRLFGLWRAMGALNSNWPLETSISVIYRSNNEKNRRNVGLSMRISRVIGA